MKKEKKRNKKVVVAMSGGIDSSVAAALLKKGVVYPELGRREVAGVFMKFWKPRIYADKKTDLHGFENRCCSSESEVRARKVAKILGIPFYVFNFQKEFKKEVVDYFLKEYKAGNTPNPCVVCNRKIKCGLLLKKALFLDADFIATGHYAKIQKRFVNSKQIRYSLISAKDSDKDQSYFLWQLNQNQLKHILFPIGDFTKAEVYKLAKKFKLPFSDIKESQEICFAPNSVDFLARYLKMKKGKIIDAKGTVLGEHEGVVLYTVGQRKRIGLAGGPYFVLAKDQDKNLLIVTKKEKDLYKKELAVKDINWIFEKEPNLPSKVKAKIRYRHQPALATISRLRSKVYSLKFNEPQRAITPGQSVVFYRDQELLGGGIIC